MMPVLYVSELNEIARDFGARFSLLIGHQLVLSVPGTLSLAILADRCEDLGSPWCEVLRTKAHKKDVGAHPFDLTGFDVRD